MQFSEPILFVELNKDSFIFVAGKYDDEQNFRIIEKSTASNYGIDQNKFVNIDKAKEAVKENISKIEENLKYVFKEIIIVLDCFDYLSINISGFKKLNGSQVIKENISYILNSLKLAISESEKDKTVIHIFNSKSVLDGTTIENLPIGLFGNFYNHELSFFLIKNNDLKNIKQIFANFNIGVKKIFLKNFVQGVQIIEKKNFKTFFKINIDKNSSVINFFYQGSFIHFEKFNFGTDMIIKDIAKVCSIEKGVIEEVLKDGFLGNEQFKEKDFLEEKYFLNTNYRKIRKKLIIEIANARIEEICNLILNKNINIKSFLNYESKVVFNIQDNLILNNFVKLFKINWSKNNNLNAELNEEFDNETIFLSTANLSMFGWSKEAIPVTQTKSSLITRIFKSIFE